ncbi:MAG TPA: NAD-dependent epimerase/dehydratase family protein [Gemmatimonadaceae bacterium]|nr:NAD-dependent epimerase/dehydratase family protein [Gemmatimonadaceae bacterium]
MRVFVTGGNGFIGSAVVRELVARGHTPVCLLRKTSDTKRIDALSFERAEGDVRDLASVRAGMARCDGTAHLAAPGGWHADDAAGLEDVIVNGARNVLESAAEIPGHRVLLVSSTAAINASDGPTVFDERAEFAVKDPRLHYAHAKHKAELVAREAFNRGVAVVIVNPAEVYGPGDTALGTSANLIDFAKAIPVLVCDGGTGVVHVDDVATGIVAALERGRPGERYILGGENITVRRMAELTLESTGRHVPIVPVPNGISRFVASAAIRLHVPVPFNPHVVPYATLYWFVDSSKARRELGVTFRDARATIASTIDWLRGAGMLN